MRTLHDNTATKPDRPIGLLTNTSMVGNMIYALVLAVSLHRCPALQKLSAHLSSLCCGYQR